MKDAIASRNWISGRSVQCVRGDYYKRSENFPWLSPALILHRAKRAFRSCPATRTANFLVYISRGPLYRLLYAHHRPLVWMHPTISLLYDRRARLSSPSGEGTLLKMPTRPETSRLWDGGGDPFQANTCQTQVDRNVNSLFLFVSKVEIFTSFSRYGDTD